MSTLSQIFKKGLIRDTKIFATNPCDLEEKEK